ncbi:MAG: T9SS type A sorting domain-containing protein, partial [Candidatus Kariarchaeaceae archaeon]
GKIYVIGGSTTLWPFTPTSTVEEYTPPQTSLTHDTGPLQFTVIDNGYIGDDGTGTYGGVVFNGNVNAMFTAGFMGGNLSFGGAYGMIGSFTSGGQPVIQDYFNVTPFSGFYSDPFFNQISSAKFGFTPNPGEESIIKNKSNTGQKFVFNRRIFTNNTGFNIINIFWGIFADWNVGGANFALNQGGYDLQRNMLYQYENGGAVDPNYYGILPVNVDPNTVMGTVDKDIVFTSLPQLRLDIFDLMTSTDFTPITEDGDYRTYLSTGPYTILSGDSLILDYAFVVGNDLSDLQANADSAIAYAQNLIPTEIEVEVNGPLTFALEQNYPNPFNPSTTINYQIPELSFITLKIYDVLGSEVATLVNEEKPIGSYKVEFDATNLPSGIYFYQLQTPNFIQTKKMILLK